TGRTAAMSPHPQPGGGGIKPLVTEALVPKSHPRERAESRYLMSRFFKSAAFPILIVIVLAFFASKLISSNDQATARSFNTFLTELDRGEVKTAVLRTKDNSIEVRLDRPDKNKYTVGYPS